MFLIVGRQLKEKRKREQLENIRKKMELKEKNKQKSLQGLKRKKQQAEEADKGAADMSPGNCSKKSNNLSAFLFLLFTELAFDDTDSCLFFF